MTIPARIAALAIYAASIATIWLATLNLAGRIIGSMRGLPL